MTGPIDTYVSDLEQALPGPRHVRRDLLTELEDGLRDAADAHQAGGLATRDAELRAVHDNGPIGDLVADYRSELATKSGRHTAMLLAITLPVATTSWDLIWYVVPSLGPALPGVATLARVIALSSVLCAVVCGLGVGLLRLSGRTSVPVRLVNSVVVVTGLLTVSIVAGSSLAMNLINLESGQALRGSAALIALTAASVIALVAVVRALVSTARTTLAMER